MVWHIMVWHIMVCSARNAFVFGGLTDVASDVRIYHVTAVLPYISSTTYSSRIFLSMVSNVAGILPSTIAFKWRQTPEGLQQQPTIVLELARDMATGRRSSVDGVSILVACRHCPRRM